MNKSISKNCKKTYNADGILGSINMLVTELQFQYWKRTSIEPENGEANAEENVRNIGKC